MDSRPTWTIIETKTFSCPSLPGFVFQYPVFKGWAVQEVESHPGKGCTIWLDHPENLDMETRPKITVLKRPTAQYPSTAARINPHRITYSWLNDPTTWENIRFDPWPATGDCVVLGVLAGDEANGFSSRILWEMVIASARRLNA